MDYKNTIITPKTDFPMRAGLPQREPGMQGVYVPLSETIRSFKAIIEGEADDYPEAAFFNVSTIEEVEKKAKQLMETENE